MTLFVRVRDRLGFERSVPVGQIPDGATVLEGVKAATRAGQALDPLPPKPEPAPTPAKKPVATAAPKEGKE